MELWYAVEFYNSIGGSIQMTWLTSLDALHFMRARSRLGRHDARLNHNIRHPSTCRRHRPSRITVDRDWEEMGKRRGPKRITLKRVLGQRTSFYRLASQTKTFRRGKRSRGAQSQQRAAIQWLRAQFSLGSPDRDQ